MQVKGKLLYHWHGNGIEESLRFYDSSQLDKDPYDVIIVGAGLVGCTLVYKLSQIQLRILLVEKEYFIGEGTSKANSALLISGFDTAVGSLESRLCREAAERWPELSQKLKIPYEQCGCIVAAFDDDETEILKDIHRVALANGVDDVRLLKDSEVQELEPNINPKVQSGIFSPRDAIGDPFAAVFALAEVALINGVDILFGSAIVAVENDTATIKSLITSAGHLLKTKILINVSGLGSLELANQYGGEHFDINPRRGQFLILDKSSRWLVKRTLFPVPHPEKGRGILVIPTIYGGLLAGPTAEDLPYGTPNPTDTTIDVLQSLLPKAARLCPDIIYQPVIGCYAGARCNCAQGSYVIRYNDGLPGVVTVTGIRSTGFTTCIALADYIIEGLVKKCGLSITTDPDARDGRAENSWPGWWKKRFEYSELIEKQPDYGHIICSCQQISRGELIDALNSPLKPMTLNAIKRMTLSQMGRCRGFDCLIQIAEIISQYRGISLKQVTQNGPGSELSAI